ncbi:Glycosyltransferase involved in cell wall bisynthesis [Succinivibrio dextrinosolvens DSM 3072]|uniref:Glycosyltransferase involved in cell wall bisynthesis n=1 Tax=Succinivibrio dextrinosolvens DSM 3072 TaxID=1123324 RepID=A0A1T4VBR1_9GAMM|nr:glycosyltransferase family 2 protein [Succinivibrio dextrinosolvens]SKA62338.1 Glycosyltransferase involved in cell wall bisynthesis [Succinivibrio dextrinosolvens DSM 3072]
MIKFSIIMAAYNAECFIEKAIKSVLSQSYSNWELVIVDDGSTDRTAEIIDYYANLDNRIVVRHVKHKGTASHARNCALDVVSGDYIQILDADDLFQNDLLDKYSNKLNQEQVDILAPDLIYFSDNKTDNVIWKIVPPQNNYKQYISGGELSFDLSLDWQLHGFFAVKRSLIDEIKYDTNALNGDEFTTRKLFYYSNKVGFVESVYFYRQNLSSTTKNINNELKMYECLITSFNLYKFTLENNMSKKILKKSKKMLVTSFWGFARKLYEYNGNKYSDGFIRAESILKNTFQIIPFSFWNLFHFKKRVFMYLSFNNYNIFRFELIFLSYLSKKLNKRFLE